jgi:hypothetical protein
VYFFGEFSGFSFGFFQSDHLFAIRTFCHLFLLICVVLGLTISNRLTMFRWIHITILIPLHGPYKALVKRILDL